MYRRKTYDAVAINAPKIILSPFEPLVLCIPSHFRTIDNLEVSFKVACVTLITIAFMVGPWYAAQYRFKVDLNGHKRQPAPNQNAMRQRCIHTITGRMRAINGEEKIFAIFRGESRIWILFERWCFQIWIFGSSLWGFWDASWGH